MSAPPRQPPPTAPPSAPSRCGPVSLDTTPAVPERPSLEGLEAKWSAAWERDGTYRFERGAAREEVFAIDTPPPTVSGSLHVGHVFSYTHTDALARYQRMRGKVVFYPMGWDDNGLPTERRVQNYYGVRCDPTVPYDPDFEPPTAPGGGAPEPAGPTEPLAISRPNFVQLCLTLTEQDERAFEELWRTLGLSVDWTMTYATIGPLAQRVSQRSFLRLLARGEAYQLQAPTLWDVDFRTAVAQAELEDRERPGAMHRVRFARASPGGAVGATGAAPNEPEAAPGGVEEVPGGTEGAPGGVEAAPGGVEGAPGPTGAPGGTADGAPVGDILIETTRPELIPACVALLTHPQDERWRGLVGRHALTPLFGTRVPVLAHPLVEPEKGTGLVMVCTFGDLTDVTWWRELSLPVRAVLGEDGRLVDVPWGEPGWESADPERARAAYGELSGRTVNQARRRIVELLGDSGELVGEPTPVTRAVKFFEKGERPVEILTSRQWFLRTVPHRDALIARGRELRWHPPHMRARYEDWVNGLTGDWCVSRQRFFGVPFPLWYPLDEHGAVRYEQPLTPPLERLPVDPSSDVPDGYLPEQRGRPGGFTGDPDVMDTWATSSLTPQIAALEGEDAELFAEVFPMDLRPQAHDIIRTWLFTTILRSHLDHDALPWRAAAISGWVLDPDRKKMSKSKGNVVTPIHLLKEHGADAVRYWAACGRPGTDTAFDPQQMKVGRRLAVKLLNASRFALADLPPAGQALTSPLDRAMIARLAALVTEATGSFEDYDYARALQRAEELFWWFCDNYLELVKGRRYEPAGAPGAASVSRALRLSISTFQRLLAPFLPFACEEVWSWWQAGSIHRAPWPDAAELTAELETGRDDPARDGGDEAHGDGGAPGEVRAHGGADETRGQDDTGGQDQAHGGEAARAREALALTVAVEVLAEVRRAKSDAKRPMRAPVQLVRVHDTPARLRALELGREDLLAAGAIARLEAVPTDAFAVEVTLAPAEDASEDA